MPSYLLYTIVENKMIRNDHPFYTRITSGSNRSQKILQGNVAIVSFNEYELNTC